MSENVVSLSNVHIVFNAAMRAPVHALRGLDLKVERGSVLGLLGPNGAGKTTAISCMLALLVPQVGHIELFGQTVSPLTPRHGAGRCGVLLEDTRLPPFLSVRAALETACALRCVDDPKRELDRVIVSAGIGELLDRRVAVLSKGQARRVGLAAAIIGDPELLILDEPSAGLDADARVDFERLVTTLRDGRRTMIVASHLLGDVEATCTDIVIVQAGRAILAGRSADLLRDARQGQASDVHVDATHASKLDALGIEYERSRYEGLILLAAATTSSSITGEEELFALLARERIVPRRVEPRVSVLSLYLETTRQGQQQTDQGPRS
jgi:ABC-type multidrug transport system ATPase subunit